MGRKFASVTEIEVTALQGCKCIQSHHLELEIGCCNNEVAALQSDHSTRVTTILRFHCISNLEAVLPNSI